METITKESDQIIQFDRFSFVVLPGFEPRQAEPKTAVLPLHHKTILVASPNGVKAVQRYGLIMILQKN